MFDETEMKLRCQEWARLAEQMNKSGHLEATRVMASHSLRADLATLLIRLGQWVAPAPAVDSIPESTAVSRARA